MAPVRRMPYSRRLAIRNRIVKKARMHQTLHRALLSARTRQAHISAEEDCLIGPLYSDSELTVLRIPQENLVSCTALCPLDQCLGPALSQSSVLSAVFPLSLWCQSETAVTLPYYVTDPEEECETDLDDCPIDVIFSKTSLTRLHISPSVVSGVFPLTDRALSHSPVYGPMPLTVMSTQHTCEKVSSSVDSMVAALFAESKEKNWMPLWDMTGFFDYDTFELSERDMLPSPFPVVRHMSSDHLSGVFPLTARVSSEHLSNVFPLSGTASEDKSQSSSISIQWIDGPKLRTFRPFPLYVSELEVPTELEKTSSEHLSGVFPLTDKVSSEHLTSVFPLSERLKGEKASSNINTLVARLASIKERLAQFELVLDSVPSEDSIISCSSTLPEASGYLADCSNVASTTSSQIHSVSTNSTVSSIEESDTGFASASSSCLNCDSNVNTITITKNGSASECSCCSTSDVTYDNLSPVDSLDLICNHAEENAEEEVDYTDALEILFAEDDTVSRTSLPCIHLPVDSLDLICPRSNPTASAKKFRRRALSGLVEAEDKWSFDTVRTSGGHSASCKLQEEQEQSPESDNWFRHAMERRRASIVGSHTDVSSCSSWSVDTLPLKSFSLPARLSSSWDMLAKDQIYTPVEGPISSTVISTPTWIHLPQGSTESVRLGPVPAPRTPPMEVVPAKKMMEIPTEALREAILVERARWMLLAVECVSKIATYEKILAALQQPLSD